MANIPRLRIASSGMATVAGGLTVASGGITAEGGVALNSGDLAVNAGSLLFSTISPAGSYAPGANRIVIYNKNGVLHYRVGTSTTEYPLDPVGLLALSNNWTAAQTVSDLNSTSGNWYTGGSIKVGNSSATPNFSLASTGIISAGQWQGTIVSPAYGGTGVANTGKTITIGGNLTTSGAYALTLTLGAATTVTLPASGTLATLAGSETFTNKTLTSPTLTAPALGAATATSINKITITQPANAATLTIVDGGTLATAGAYVTTLTSTNTTSVTLPTTGTLATLAGSETFTNKTLTSPTLTTPALGAATATTINKVTITQPANAATLTIVDGKTLIVNNKLTFSGTDDSTVAFGGGGTATYTTSKLSVFASTTSAELAGVISDETGSGLLVFATAPTFATSVDSGATFTAFASATTLTVGYTGTAASTTNISTGAVLASTIKTVNIGTGGVASSTTNVNIGSATGGLVTVNSSLTVTGDLTVNGTTTTINSTTLSVDDKNIELASIASPTDTTADGAGITVKGASDKTLNWVSTTAAWTSSENFDLAAVKTYKIGTANVLSSSTLSLIGNTYTSTLVANTGQAAARAFVLPLLAGTLIGTGDSATVTNTMLAGSIANSKLTNNTVQYGTTSVALGATSATIAGLTSIGLLSNSVATSFQGSATAVATTYIFPPTAGSNGQTLTTNGSGTLSWGAGSTLMLATENTWTANQIFTSISYKLNTTAEALALTNPAVGYIKMYFKDDGFLYKRTDSGAESVFSSGSGGGGGSSSSLAFATIFGTDLPIITGGSLSSAGSSFSITSDGLSLGVPAPDSTTGQISNINQLTLTDLSVAPGAPGTGKFTLYSRSGSLYYKSGNGAETLVGSGGGGGGTTTNALTIGTGLSGTASTFDGSAANAISINYGNANTWTAAQTFNDGLVIPFGKVISSPVFNGANGGLTAGTTYYVKLFDFTTGSVNSKYQSYFLKFKLLSYAWSEYSADVEIFIPSYAFYEADAGIPQVTIKEGGITSQSETFKNILITGTISNTTFGGQVWLQFYADNAARGIDISTYPGSSVVTWTGQTTTAPSNIQKTVPFLYNYETKSAGLNILGNIRLSGSTSGYVGLAAAAAAGSTTYTLPAAAPGANGYVLTSTTAGVMSWAAASGGASLSVANTWTAIQTFSPSLSTYGTGGTRFVDLNGSFTGSSNDIAGFRLGTLLNPSANITNAYGSRIEPTFTPANLTTVVYVVTQRIAGSTGSTTGAITSYQNLLIQAGYGTIKPTTAYGAYIDNHGSASITNSYGLYVAAQSGSTNAYSAIFAGGNVGIGTTSPQSPLDIQGATGFFVNLRRANGANGDGPDIRYQKSRGSIATPAATVSGDYLGTITFDGYDGASFVRGAGIYATINGTVATNSIPTDLQFLTLSGTTLSERMRITAAGKVGIGTATPSAYGALTVAGDVFVGPVGSGGYGRLAYNTTLVSLQSNVYWNATSNVSSVAGYSSLLDLRLDDGSIRFSTSASVAVNTALVMTERMIITASGNVGIGTTSPATLLHVDSSGYASFYLGTNGANGFHITKESTDQSFNIWSGAFGSGVNRLKINSSGNVGIGVTTVGAKLDVAGTLRLNGTTVGTNYTEIKAAAAATAATYTLPSAVPSTTGQVLSSDTSGNMSWTTPTSTVNFARTFFLMGA